MVRGFFIFVISTVWTVREVISSFAGRKMNLDVAAGVVQRCLFLRTVVYYNFRLVVIMYVLSLYHIVLFVCSGWPMVLFM